MKRGLSKKRLEQVPCESKAARSPREKKPKLKPGQFPGLSLNGSQIVDLGSQIIREYVPIIEDYLKRKNAKPKKPKRNRRPKTRVGRVPGTFYTTPF